MKTKNQLFMAFLLGILTLTLQIGQSVAEDAPMASRETAPVLAEITAFGPLRAIRAPAPVVIVKEQQIEAKKSISVQSQKPYLASVSPVLRAERIDPLAAIVQPDILPRHQALTRQVLSLLPVDCQAKLRQYYVIYDKPDFRGSTGKGVIIMNGSLSDENFVRLLTHEALGHFWDLTCIDGTPASGATAFLDGSEPIWNDDPSAEFYGLSWLTSRAKKKVSISQDFVSVYAKTDPFEDLAETAAYYVLQPESFRIRASKNTVIAQKLAWFDAHFPLSEPLATGSTWTGTIPADAAKGSYTWKNVVSL